MPARALAATLVAAMTFVAANEVRAADLYGEGYNPPDSSEYYEEAPAGACDDRSPCDDATPRRYTDGNTYQYERREEYEYRGGSVKDGYPVPVAPPPRTYSEERYSEGRYRTSEAACAPRWQIKRRLRDEGWVDLRPLDRDGPLGSLQARRLNSGRMFIIDIDKCSGDIVHARPAFLRTFGAYEPRRWYDRQPY